MRTSRKIYIYVYNVYITSILDADSAVAAAQCFSRIHCRGRKVCCRKPQLLGLFTDQYVKYILLNGSRCCPLVDPNIVASIALQILNR